LNAAEAEARHFMGRPVGVLQEALDHDFYSECGIADLAADALRERMGAEAAILSGGLFHKSLPAGTVTLLDLDDACFTTANPQLSLVRGEQVRMALERGLDPELMRTYFKAYRGAPLGLPAISGMAVIYDRHAASGERVRQVMLQGQVMRDDQLVRLAHTDAEVRREISPFGLLDLEPGQVLLEEVPTILREVIEDFMQSHSPTPRPAGGRWQRAS
jgi:2',3'-cyclic-nucleotide 2'-phosphodiesterase (5'-nucleotidase family)